MTQKRHKLTNKPNAGRQQAHHNTPPSTKLSFKGILNHFLKGDTQWKEVDTTVWGSECKESQFYTLLLGQAVASM